MEVRQAKLEDIPDLVRLHERHTFPFPEFKNMLYILVIEDKGRIVAWGYTKKHVEVVFVPDKTSPKATIVKSLKLISEKSSELAKKIGIEMLHSYVKDEKFAKLLVDKFNYGVCDGTPLFLDLDDNGKRR